jgi:streptogramin lyase
MPESKKKTKRKVRPSGSVPAKPAITKKLKTKEKSTVTKASSYKGLIMFGIVVGAVILLALVTKWKQGPPIKMMGCNVLTTYEVTTEKALGSPRGIAVGTDGAVYVADLGNARVVKFNNDGSVNKIWGSEGANPGQFKEPSGVAVNAQGEVYVADTWNGRIQKFSATAEFVGEISNKAGNFYSPRNVAVDTAGYVYVADTGNSCIKKFDTDGNLIKKWG